MLKHEQNPEWYPNPDDITVLEGVKYDERRNEYTRMSNRNALEPGHHILGIADGD